MIVSEPSGSVFEIGDEVGHRVVVDAGGVGVGLADVDGHVRQRLFECRHGKRVVAVSVGQQNIFERDALAFDEREQFFRLVARVDERGGLRFLVDEQVAIRLQGADDSGDDFHEEITPFFTAFSVRLSQRERPVVERFDLHVGAEFAGFNMVALFAADGYELFIHRDGDLRPRGA